MGFYFRLHPLRLHHQQAGDRRWDCKSDQVACPLGNAARSFVPCQDEQALPWSAWLPAALAAASVMYSPCLVLP